MKYSVFQLFLLLLWAYGADAESVSFDSPGAFNPIVPGYFADPSIKQFGDTFYLYATTDGNGGGSGVSATTAINCVGYNENSNVSGGCGIYARIATSCYGFSYNATAINATLAIGCIGFSPAGTPLNVVQNVNSIVSGY